MGELIGADVWAAYSVMTYLFNVTPPSIIFTLSLHDALPISLGALAFLGGTFMPDFREGHFVMQVSSSITGTSLEQMRSEEHTSELQSRFDLVCRLLLEKKNRSTRY